MKPHRGTFDWEVYRMLYNKKSKNFLRKEKQSEESFQTTLQANRSLEMVKLKSDCSGGVPKFLGQTGNGSVPRGPFWQWGRAYVRGRALRGPGAACSHPHRLGVFPVQKVALCPALHFTLFCRWPLSIGLSYPSLDFIHLSVCLLISLFTLPMPSSFLPLLNVSRALTKD